MPDRPGEWQAGQGMRRAGAEGLGTWMSGSAVESAALVQAMSPWWLLLAYVLGVVTPLIIAMITGSAWKWWSK